MGNHAGLSGTEGPPGLQDFQVCNQSGWSSGEQPYLRDCQNPRHHPRFTPPSCLNCLTPLPNFIQLTHINEMPTLCQACYQALGIQL